MDDISAADSLLLGEKRSGTRLVSPLTWTGLPSAGVFLRSGKGLHTLAPLIYPQALLPGNKLT